jgi:hypothetical protein
VFSDEIGSTLDRIIESQVRILFILSPMNNFYLHLVDYLYDAGMRKEDFVIYNNAFLANMAEFEDGSNVVGKRTNLLDRSFALI